MRYLYHPTEGAANPKKHGFDFDDVPQVVDSGATVTFEERPFLYGAQRFITQGLLRGTVVVIATAETEEEIRVIPMRRAERNEEEIYCRNL